MWNLAWSPTDVYGVMASRSLGYDFELAVRSYDAVSKDSKVAKCGILDPYSTRG